MSEVWIWGYRVQTDAEAPTLWPPDEKSRLTGKDPDAGKKWGQEEKEVTEDEMVGWHHWLMSLSKLWETVEDRGGWYAAVHGVAKNLTQLGDLTTNRKSCSNQAYKLEFKVHKEI